LTELEEVVVKLTDLNVKNVIFDLHELVDSLIELVKNDQDGVTKDLTLGVTNLNLGELVELDDGSSEMHDVLASLREAVKTHEQGI